MQPRATQPGSPWIKEMPFSANSRMSQIASLAANNYLFMACLGYSRPINLVPEQNINVPITEFSRKNGIDGSLKNAKSESKIPQKQTRISPFFKHF